MSSDAISKALDELRRARLNILRVSNRQVRSDDDRAMMRATAMAWFHSHRPVVVREADVSALVAVDDAYQRLLSGADRSTLKKTYLAAMAEAKAALIELRKRVVVVHATADAAPDFKPLASDAEMRGILERRWVECTKCVEVKAHLAGIVMMGGLLEALFVAKAIALKDKGVLFAAPSAPKTGKHVPFNEWMLATYLLVAHDLKWISQAQRDVAKVLGEYRNYVHPEKERRHGVELAAADAQILWGVTKSLAAQLLT